MKRTNKHTVTFEIDTTALSGVTDEALVAYWHIAQANPAPHGDPRAGELADRIGHEIIRRWLAEAPTELFHHQGRDYYWNELRQLGKWNSEGEFVPGGVRVDGEIVSPEEATAARPRVGPHLLRAATEQTPAEQATARADERS